MDREFEEEQTLLSKNKEWSKRLMEKQKKKQNGITLIALVITIIVMLILAGVSLNALIGDNGIIRQAQYASFLAEMSAVEEAVQMWKTEHYDDENYTIPSNGMIPTAEIDDSERLGGEIGYYRTWSKTSRMPQPAEVILSDASSFNSIYLGDLVYFPRGVEDLYYLDNKGLNLSKNKKYVIDAANSMIYSVQGISLKGVRCYSLAMAKAVMNGTFDTPDFIAAEVSGDGSSLVYAGSRYYIDKNGNYVDENGLPVDEPIENPYGFQIIASPNSNNIFKLYNNGDLYGKGVKGIQLNTSKEEMDKITPYAWKSLGIPLEVGTNYKIYPTLAGLFLIDAQNDLWSIGNNYGLTDELRISYSGREWVKLDLGSYKVKNVFGTGAGVYIVTTDNKLLGTGTNQYGQLGDGTKNVKNTFVLISGIPNPETIQSIYGNNYSGEGGSTIIKCIDSSGNNHFYLCGTDAWGGLGFNLPHSFSTTTFLEVFNGQTGRGDNIANDLVNIYTNHHEYWLMWFKNGEVYRRGWAGAYANGKYEIPKVVDVRWSQTLSIYKCDNNGTTEYYGQVARGNYGLGSEFYHYSSSQAPRLLTLPNLPLDESFIDFDVNGSACYFLTNKGNIYAKGVKSQFGNINDYIGWTTNDSSDANMNNGWLKLTTISGIDSFYNSNFVFEKQFHGQLFLSKDNVAYLTNNISLMYGNDILQKTWTLVANNVESFDARNCAYITKGHDVYVAGADSRELGLGTLSESQVAVNNYVKITQTEIAGKGAKVLQDHKATYIITTDGDLYAAGYSEMPSSSEYSTRGWETTDDEGNLVCKTQTTYIKLWSNVKDFYSNGWTNPKCIITNDSKMYALGKYTPFTGYYTGTTYRTFTNIPFPEAIGSANNVKKWLFGGPWRSYILGNDGNLYLAGTWTAVFGGGMSKSSYAFEKFTYGLSLNEGESIVDAASLGQNNCMMLTNKGRLFGFGNACYLGIGQSEDTLTANLLIESSHINGKKLIQIVAGSNFYIAVDSEGKVYGTGNNTYGLLGRWLGSDRTTPNSRYRTAFEWVECPELEI